MAARVGLIGPHEQVRAFPPEPRGGVGEAKTVRALGFRGGFGRVAEQTGDGVLDILPALKDGDSHYARR
jgi:hypothetical protein